MHTISNPKKALFVAIFLVLATFSGGNLARAQVAEPATTAQVDALRETLISLLTQMIAQLQAQIAELISKQAETNQVLGSVQNQVNEVVKTTPVIEPFKQEVTLGVAFCDFSSGAAKIPLSGVGWKEVVFTYPSYPSQNDRPVFTSPMTGKAIVRVGVPYLRIQTGNGWPTNYELSGVAYENENEGGKSTTFSQSVSLPACQ